MKAGKRVHHAVASAHSPARAAIVSYSGPSVTRPPNFNGKASVQTRQSCRRGRRLLVFGLRTACRAGSIRYGESREWTLVNDCARNDAALLERGKNRAYGAFPHGTARDLR